MRLFDLPNNPAATLLDVLDFQARQNGAAVWLRQEERRVTFAQARADVDHYAAGFAALGLKRRECVAVVGLPSVEVVLVCLGIARAGGIFTTINTDYKGDFLHGAIDDTLARFVVIDAELAARWDAGRAGRVEHLLVMYDEAPKVGEPLASLRMHGELASPPALDALEAVQVWWSSGTTGKSKGVCHPHSSILRLAWDTASRNIRPRDVLYSCTPMYLGSSWTGTVWPALVAGVCGAIDARFSASKFWSRLAYYDATYFFTLGAMHMHLLKAPVTAAERAHRVRYAQAIPLTWEQIPVFKSRFNIEQLPQAYGTSETFMIFRADDDGTPWRGAALGRPVDHFEVKLFDDFDREVPAGEAGEICVRPKIPGTMFVGYYNQPQMTLNAWRNLWHHTGDMAYRDDDGIYYFADRKKDYIRYNGRNISMFEVEEVADRHPELADVCAFGIVSKELESESELCLAVVHKPGHSPHPDDIAKFINENAPYYFVPRYIIAVGGLPRNAHGRVMKNELRDKGVPPDAWDRIASQFIVQR